MFITLLSVIPGVIGSFIVTKEIKEINSRLSRFNPNVPEKESFIDYMKKQWLWYILLFAPFGMNLLVVLPIELYIFHKTKRFLKRTIFMPRIKFGNSINNTESLKKEPIKHKGKAVTPADLNNMDIAIEKTDGPRSYSKTRY